MTIAASSKGPTTADDPARRRETMSLAGRATAEELAPAAGLAGDGWVEIRAPEVGLVMVRGRIGGDGAPFNLGEATVTRAAVRLSNGAIGFGHLLGRDKARARLAALVDALWADPDRRPEIEAEILAPVRARLAAAEAVRGGEVAASRVDFFTMVRGDD